MFSTHPILIVLCLWCHFTNSAMFVVSLLIVLRCTAPVLGQCTVPPISTVEYSTSDTIITATMNTLHTSKGAAMVKVRRVFKGDTRLQGKMVRIEGLDKKDICIPALRQGDTKLFFLRRVKGLRNKTRPTFTLDSSMQKVNLQNLKVLWNLEAQEKSGWYKVRVHIIVLSLFTPS